jgi:membrane protein DedA with SNARE-associated domain
MRRWYGRYGSVTVLATRLIGYVRPWSSLVAGAAEFPFGPFLLWTVVGTMLFVYPTMKLTAVIFLLWRRSPILHLLISLAFLVSFGALVIYGIIRRRMTRSTAEKS